MREILSVEQPCVLCGQALEVVTISRDDETGEEQIERTALLHTMGNCSEMRALMAERFPRMTRNNA
jgi:hypothetical protein